MSTSLTLAFVMDPPESIDIDGDTTFALMLEAQQRGHRVSVIDQADLSIAHGRVEARVSPVTLRREPGNHLDRAPAEDVALDDHADVVFQRKDPPVDADYVEATQILALLERSLVLNRPRGILEANEKLYTIHFADLMPPTLVTRHIAKLREFLSEMGGDIVVKPISGRGGEGIFRAREGDSNLSPIFEELTRFGTRRAMAQRFLPEVKQGDKRILLLDGEPLGAVMRVPGEREFRANLHVGGRAEKAAIDERDREIIDRLRPWLQQDGLFFVGIDVIGGYLTEVNVTSPTCLQEMTRFDGRPYPSMVLDRIEAVLSDGGDSQLRR